VHAELRRIAGAHFAHERPGHTLQPTELIQEVFIRLIKPGAGPWNDRGHFFRIASRAMRQILVDHARTRRTRKRGGGLVRVDLNELVLFAPEESSRLIELDQALSRLEQLSERQSKVVELRFFGGLSVRETAEVLRVGVTTVKQDWALAKAWLERELDKPS